MDKKYYDIAVQINRTVHNNPKFDPVIRVRIQEILGYKQEPIMSWFLVYMKGVCTTLGLPDMNDYVALESVDGVPIHYAITMQEAKVMTVGLDSYQNYYSVDEDKFILSWLNHVRKRGIKPNRIVAYLDQIWFVEKKNIPDNFKVVDNPILEKISPENEKIG